jgi:hypothetical protein
MRHDLRTNGRVLNAAPNGRANRRTLGLPFHGVFLPDLSPSPMAGFFACVRPAGPVFLLSKKSDPHCIPVAFLVIAAAPWTDRFEPSDKAHMSFRRALGRSRIPSSYETRPLRTVLNT